MQLELRHLRTLCAIADAGSLCRAAAAVGVSQPALTAQLRRIEAALGGEVFRRSRMGIAPTPFGMFVISRTRSVLLAVDELLTGTDNRMAASSVRIGGYATPVLTGLVQRLFDLPGTHITVHTEYSPRLLLDLLVSHGFDAATLVDYPGHELPVPADVEMRVVASEPVSVALPAGHRLAALAEVPLVSLAEEDWLITPPDGAGWPGLFLHRMPGGGLRTPGPAHHD
ncbi:LysR family transcriptional regulator [Streptomyces ardesiacus]